MIIKKSALFLCLTIFLCASFTPAQTTGKVDVFKPATIKSNMLRAAEWQLKNPKHKLYDWTNGAFYAGVFAAYETTKSPVLWKAMMDMGEATEWKPGPRFDHADDIAISQTYIDIYRVKKDRKYIQPTIDAIEKLKKETGPEVARHGITWWWCDAIFMGPPTLAMLGKTLKDPSYNRLNDRLFDETYNLLYDKEHKLFARDASYLINAKGEGKREANGRKIFWSRGNGWVVGGLLRLVEELPKNDPKRAYYLGIYREMMDSVLALQPADGLWRSSLLDTESYPHGEASGSGFYCYAMAWGVNNKVLDRAKYLPAIRKTWTALNGLVSPEGRVGWVQPIGADPRRNFSEESWEVYGTGAYLLAGSEMSKLKLKQ